MLDLYSYSASFGLVAAAAGATAVLAVDRSQQGLELAEASAERNGLARALSVERREAFAALDELAAAKERFGVVIADPPAFVRSKKELKPGLRGYRKLARAAATLVERGGLPRDRLLLAQRRRRRLRRRGPARPARCRAGGPPDPSGGRRPRPSEPSLPAGVGVPKVLSLRSDLNH